MPLRSGTYEVGPENGSLLIRTKRAGAAARIGHDLVLEATAWHATVVADAEDPARSSLTVTVDAGSFVVLEGSGGALPLSDGQRGEIVDNIRDKVLHSARHPTITFTSRAVEGTAKRAKVSGELRLAGRTRPAVLDVSVAERAGGVRLTGAMSITQTDFGITPYRAFLGQLRVADVVELSVDVRLGD
jgi:polyisoprenoid-binding protein YceI